MSKDKTAAEIFKEARLKLDLTQVEVAKMPVSMTIHTQYLSVGHINLLQNQLRSL